MTYTLITTKTFCRNDSDLVSASQNLEKNQHVAFCDTKGVLSLEVQLNRDKGAWSKVNRDNFSCSLSGLTLFFFYYSLSENIKMKCY